jgi:hypothetical protein
MVIGIGDINPAEPVHTDTLWRSQAGIGRKAAGGGDAPSPGAGDDPRLPIRAEPPDDPAGSHAATVTHVNVAGRIFPKSHRVEELDSGDRTTIPELGRGEKVMPQIEVLGIEPANAGKIDECE